MRDVSIRPPSLTQDQDAKGAGVGRSMSICVGLMYVHEDVMVFDCGLGTQVLTEMDEAQPATLCPAVTMHSAQGCDVRQVSFIIGL